MNERTQLSSRLTSCISTRAPNPATRRSGFLRQLVEPSAQRATAATAFATRPANLRRQWFPDPPSTLMPLFESYTTRSKVGLKVILQDWPGFHAVGFSGRLMSSSLHSEPFQSSSAQTPPLLMPLLATSLEPPPSYFRLIETPSNPRSPTNRNPKSQSIVGSGFRVRSGT